MEKADLWDKKQENFCEFCIYSKSTIDETKIICSKKNNIFNKEHTCGKFSFDIFKKEVIRRRRPNFGKFSKEQFTL